VVFWVLRGVEIQKLKIRAVATGCLLGDMYLSDLHLEDENRSLLKVAQFQRLVVGVTIRYTVHRSMSQGRSLLPGG
jgi:hypothetical protein